MKLLVLDSGPLGLLTRPRHIPAAQNCATWLRGILHTGWRVAIPAIADYEVRRELVRLQSSAALTRLNILTNQLGVLPITNDALQHAALLWANARRAGKPAADPHALDGDVILAAQALGEVQPNEDVIVATTNVAHLNQFVPASVWDVLFLLGMPDADVLGVQTLELPSSQTSLDTVIRLRQPDGRDSLHLIEWQGWHDPTFLWRVLGYLSWLGQHHAERPILATLIYLKPADDVGDTLIQQRAGMVGWQVHIPCIRLW